MAASSSPQQDHQQPQESKHRRHHRQLNVEVPPVPATGCFAGCFRHSPTSTSVAHAHTDRPASPSLIRSPSAWIRSRGHSFGSKPSNRHNRRRSGDFQYDARSYARNFDEGTDGSGDDEAGVTEGDAIKYLCFSSRLPSSPPTPSPSEPSPGGTATGKELALRKGPDLQ